MKSKRLLVAFVEFMFEDIEPTDLKWLEKTVFESMRKRMENSKKIHDWKSKGWSSSHWGWRPTKDSSELDWENNRKTTEQTTEKQQENKEDMKNEEEDKKEKEKKKYLDYVYLTDEEYKKIQDRYGDRVLKDFIERVDNRIWMKPNSKDRKERDHYRTILTWIRREWIKEIQKPKQLSEYEIEEWVYDLDRLI